MKHHIFKKVLHLLLSISLISVILTPTVMKVNGNTPTIVYISERNFDPILNETTVFIHVETLEKFLGFEFDMTYDSQTITYKSFHVESPFVQAAVNTSVQNRIRVAVMANAFYSGNTTIAKVVFIGEARAEVMLTRVLLGENSLNLTYLNDYLLETSHSIIHHPTQNPKLTIHFSPSDASIQDVVYKSLNEDVLSINAYGEIIPLSNGEATIQVTSKDNQIIKYITMDVDLDLEGPTFDFTLNPIELTNRNVELNITWSDTHDIKSIKYLKGYHDLSTVLSEGIDVNSEEPLVLVFEDNDFITMVGEDIFGNTSLSHYQITNIDKVAPVITILPYTTTPINQDITVNATTNEGTLNKTSHTFTENGSFTFIATDEAGNVTEKTVTITNIDKTLPIIEGVEDLGIYNTNRIIIFDQGNATLNGSHIESGYEVSIDGVYELNVIASSGNQVIINFTIDKTPPVITILPYNTDPTEQNITVEATTNEGTLNKTSHTFTENGSFTFIATDNAGNVTEKTVTITNIIRDVEVNTSIIGAGGKLELYVNNTLFTSNKVTLGSDLEVRLIVESGFRLYELKVNGVEMSVLNNSLMISNITEPLTIQAEFLRLGDLNGDGVVSTTDLVTLRRFLAGLTTLDSKGEAAADLDGNGSITTTDLVRLRRQLAGLE